MTEETKILQSLDEIKDLLRLILENFEKKSTGNVKEESLEVKIANIFRELGISSHLGGYDYATSAILMCIESPELIHRYSITKVLYPNIAKKHATTPNRVERAIRHAIEVCFKRTSKEYLEKIFGPSILNNKKRPTNSEFIAAIIEFLKFN